MTVFSRISIIPLLFITLLLTGCPETEGPNPGDTVLGPPTAPGDDPYWQDGDYDGSRSGQSTDQSTYTQSTETINPELIPLEERDPAMTEAMLNPGAEQTPFESIYFGFDEFSIRASERPKLALVADYLRSNPSASIVAEGHTDWRGTEAYNLGLGDRRANTVKEYLSSGLSIEPSRIDVLSKGELEATENTAKSDAVSRQDRRVDIFVVQ